MKVQIRCASCGISKEVQRDYRTLLVGSQRDPPPTSGGWDFGYNTGSCRAGCINWLDKGGKYEHPH